MKRLGIVIVVVVLAGAIYLTATKPRVDKVSTVRKDHIAEQKEPAQPSTDKMSEPDRKAKSTYDKAEELARTGKLEEGLKLLDSIETTVDEKSFYAPFSQYQKANWLFYAGRVKEAREVFAQVETKYADHYLSVRAAKKRAEIDLRAERLEAAISEDEPTPLPLVGPDAEDSKTTADCGPECLVEACKILGIKASKKELKTLSKTTDQGTTMLNMAKAARAKGLEAKGQLVNYQYLQEMPKPVIAWVNGNHYVLVKEVGGASLTTFDPNEGERIVARSSFCQEWRGQILALGLPKKADAKTTRT